MKRMLTLLVLAGLVASVAGIQNASANLLLNPNIDTPSVSAPTLPASWTVEMIKTLSGPASDLASLEGFCNVEAAGGTGLFYKAFQGGTLAAGNLATANLYQDVAGSAGTKYRLTGWAGAAANYSGMIAGSPTKSQLALEFLNAGSTVIGGTILDLQANGLGTGSTPGLGFGYKQFAIVDTAPAGTAFVRARSSMIDGYNNPAGGDQAYVADTFDLTVVPEPATLSLFGLAVFGLIGFRRRSK